MTKQEITRSEKGVVKLELAIFLIGFVVVVGVIVLSYSSFRETPPSPGPPILKEIVKNPEGRWVLYLENGRIYVVDIEKYCDFVEGRSLRYQFPVRE